MSHSSENNNDAATQQQEATQQQQRLPVKFMDEKDNDTLLRLQSSRSLDSSAGACSNNSEINNNGPPELTEEATTTTSPSNNNNNNNNNGTNDNNHHHHHQDETNNNNNNKLSSSDLLQDDDLTNNWNMSVREQKILERLTSHDAVNQLLVKRDCKEWNNFLENATLLDEIRKDVNRTHPHLYFYLEPHLQLGPRRYAALERILFVWAKLNKGVSVYIYYQCIVYIMCVCDLCCCCCFIDPEQPSLSNTIHSISMLYRRFDMSKE